MADTVWLRLTTVVKKGNKSSQQEETFLFGPTGVVRFKQEGKFTYLYNHNNELVAKVAEDAETILISLRKVRRT
jgi:hypothetical protein